MFPKFTDLLAVHLHRRGMSGSDLAEAVGGMSQQTIWRVTTGKRPPDVDSLGKMADALGLEGQERRDFVFAGGLANCPIEIVQEFEAMQRDRDDLEKRIFALEAIIDRFEAKRAGPPGTPAR